MMSASTYLFRFVLVVQSIIFIYVIFAANYHWLLLVFGMYSYYVVATAKDIGDKKAIHLGKFVRVEYGDFYPYAVAFYLLFAVVADILFIRWASSF